MFQQSSKVLFNQQLGPDYYKIGLACSEHYTIAKAGQFIMLRFDQPSQPLLRRPYSIHNLILTNGQVEGFEVLYKVVGTGTAALARQRPGDRVDILGPLGTGFIIPGQIRRIYFAAGGIGVAPLVFLAHQLSRRGTDLADSRAFIGGRSQSDLLCRDEFVNLGIPVQTTTDDGSAGDQCLVTHPLETLIERQKPELIVACGPTDMLGCVVAISEKFDLPCQVSIESMMACGMGACLGCAVEGRGQRDRYLHACLDGPVFDAADLRF
jgi:dihydroorotate dehydrogenase electron transfer subunit